jgi:AcrR family transcriptional regulator
MSMDMPNPQAEIPPLPPPGAPPVSHADGRRRRSANSRRAIVEAMIDLIRAGDPSPSAEAVAARAGVGRRTVFRLFSDMEGIYREMQVALRERVAPVRAIPLPDGPDPVRLVALAQRRIRFFEEVLPVWVAGGMFRSRSVVLQQEHHRLQAELRGIVLDVLPDPVRGDAVLVEALDAILSLDCWRRLRYEQGLPPDAAGDVVIRIVTALVPGGDG